MFTTIKSPDGDLPYSIDWSQWLGADTITASAWTVPSPLTKHSQIIVDGNITVVWIAGGAISETPYIVSNDITTATGKKDRRSIEMLVQQR